MDSAGRPLTAAAPTGVGAALELVAPVEAALEEEVVIDELVEELDVLLDVLITPLVVLAEVVGAADVVEEDEDVIGLVVVLVVFMDELDAAVVLDEAAVVVVVSEFVVNIVVDELLFEVPLEEDAVVVRELLENELVELDFDADEVVAVVSFELRVLVKKVPVILEDIEEEVVAAELAFPEMGRTDD